MHLVWCPKDLRHYPPSVFHSLRVQSLEADTSRLHSAFRCRGTHTMHVTNLLCPYSLTVFYPLMVCTWILPDFSAHASFSASGDQLRVITQSSHLISLKGVCVKVSQRRTVPSPEPLARLRESGLKLMYRTASVWPYMLLEERVMGLTLKGQAGWQLISKCCSQSW